MNFYYQRQPLAYRIRDFLESRAMVMLLVGVFLIVLVVLIGVVNIYWPSPVAQLNPTPPSAMAITVAADENSYLLVTELYSWKTWPENVPGVIRVPSQIFYFSTLQQWPEQFIRIEQSAQMFYGAHFDVYSNLDLPATSAGEPVIPQEISPQNTAANFPLLAIGTPQIGFPPGPVTLKIRYKVNSVTTQLFREQAISWRTLDLSALCPDVLRMTIIPPPGTTATAPSGESAVKLRLLDAGNSPVPSPANTFVNNLLYASTGTGGEGVSAPTVIVNSPCAHGITVGEISTKYFPGRE